jgi:hypothetical protein
VGQERLVERHLLVLLELAAQALRPLLPALLLPMRVEAAQVLILLVVVQVAQVAAAQVAGQTLLARLAPQIQAAVAGDQAAHLVLVSVEQAARVSLSFDLRILQRQLQALRLLLTAALLPFTPTPGLGP